MGRTAYVTATSFAIGFTAVFTASLLFAAFGWITLFFTVPMCFLMGTALGEMIVA